MPPTIAPQHIRHSRLQNSQWIYEPLHHPRYSTVFPSFDGATDLEAFRTEIVIAGLEANAHHSNRFARSDYQVNRIELVWQSDTIQRERRGAVLFSPTKGALLHVLHALVGYGGNGPGLTEHLFKLLGAAELFDDVNNAARDDHPYHLVVSREPTGVIEGIETALPWSEPLEQWRWWRIS